MSSVKMSREANIARAAYLRGCGIGPVKAVVTKGAGKLSAW